MDNIDGIVLKNIDYGEADRIIHMLTEDYGRISAIVMGARKTKSTHSATTQVLTYGSYGIYRQGQGMGRISSSDIIESYPHTKADLLLSTYAMYLLDLTDRVTEDNERVAPLYQILLETLSMIESLDYDAEILVRIYEIKLFALRGYRPQLDECGYCQCEDADYNYIFSLSSGGFLCQSCKAIDPYHISISNKTAKLLRIFQYIKLEQIGKIEIKEKYRKELEKINRYYIEEFFTLKMKWHDMIKDIKSMDS